MVGLIVAAISPLTLPVGRTQNESLCCTRKAGSHTNPLGGPGVGVLSVATRKATARAPNDGQSQLALSIRVGVYTGEVELWDQDIGGLGVHIAGRISSMAESDEVQATRTVDAPYRRFRVRNVDRNGHSERPSRLASLGWAGVRWRMATR